jgi:hypothetical protein
VIPDDKADSNRLRSIATMQKRLQTLIDEGRMLRRSLEVMSAAAEFMPRAKRTDRARLKDGNPPDDGGKKIDQN